MNAIKGGIELTGTLFTSAQGSAKDKLAYAQQIFDDTYGASGEFQHNINAKVKQLSDNAITPTEVDSKIAAAKTEVKGYTDTQLTQKVTNQLGNGGGIATLEENGKLPVDQLPALKTVNGNSIVGSGDITIDLNIYEVVTTLPTSNINPHKIYLVLSETSGTNNLYTEYAYINSKWEILGQYKADVDLTPYVKKADLPEFVHSIEAPASNNNGVSFKVNYNEYGSDGNVITSSESRLIPLATQSANGVMSSSDKHKLDSFPDYVLTGVNPPYSVKDGLNVVIENHALDSNDTYQPADVINLLIPNVSATTNGVMTSAMFTKLNNVAANATADSAITTAELEAILV